MIIDKDLLDKVSEQAKVSPRLRMNYNFHQSLDDKCHRFLNAVEPGTEVPIHKHPTKDETFVILRAGCAECMVGFFVISSGVVMTGEGFRSGNEKFICILFA